MSFAGRLSLSLSLLLAPVLTAVLLTGSAEAAKQSQPRLSGFSALVGKGGKVALAASNMTTSDLAARRPGYEKLQPRARSNAE